MRTRQMLGILLTVTAAAAGVLLAWEGTSSASIDPPAYAWTDVQIGTAPPDESRQQVGQQIEVNLVWVMTSDQTVGVRASAQDLIDRDNPARFSLVLYCDARFTELPGPSSGSVVGSSAGGEEQACEDKMVAPTAHDDSTSGVAPTPKAAPETELAWQQIDFIGNATIEGRLRGRWSAEKFGERIARTPSVAFGIFSKHSDLFEPAASSQFTTVLTAQNGETLYSAYPSQLEEGTVSYDPGYNGFTADATFEASSIAWANESRDSSSSPNDLSAGTARWNQLAGKQLPQLYTLVAGVLLGLVVAVLIDWLLRDTPRTEAALAKAPRRRR